LAAVYPRESLPAVRKALNSDDFAMQRLAENLTHAGFLKIFQVPESDVGFYRNLNDPTDLQSLSSEHVFSFNARSATESNV
jgi:hypothetical protein